MNNWYLSLLQDSYPTPGSKMQPQDYSNLGKVATPQFAPPSPTKQNDYQQPDILSQLGVKAPTAAAGVGSVLPDIIGGIFGGNPGGSGIDFGSGGQTGIIPGIGGYPDPIDYDNNPYRLY